MLFPNMSREELEGAVSRASIISTLPITEKNQTHFFKGLNDLCLAVCENYKIYCVSAKMNLNHASCTESHGNIFISVIL